MLGKPKHLYISSFFACLSLIHILDTYTAEQMREELTALMESDQPLPAVILYNENGQMPKEGEKWRMLQEYLTAGEYALLYENDGFIVYGTACAAE